MWINVLTAASEAACLILSVDETIKNPRSSVDGPPGGACRGRSHRRPHAKRKLRGRIKEKYIKTFENRRSKTNLHWFNDHLRDLMKKRDFALKIALKSGSINDR